VIRFRRIIDARGIGDSVTMRVIQNPSKRARTYVNEQLASLSGTDGAIRIYRK